MKNNLFYLTGMKIIYLFIVILLFISCGDNSNDTTTCNPVCNEWESCINGKCKITRKGACNQTEDCINSGDICKNNKCIKSDYCDETIKCNNSKEICKNNKCIIKVNCNEWETYDENRNLCIISSGRCTKKIHCKERQYCNSANYCKDYPSVNWTNNCPSYISTNAECTTIKLPLNYNQDNGKTVDIFVYRHKAISGNSKGQIWFLAGGPGGSGAVFSQNYFDDFTQKYPDYDFYSMDHRGAGNSSRLTCKQENSMENLTNLKKCTDELSLNMGNDIQQYSTTNAAKDLGLLLDIFKKPGKKRYIYGLSYGTYWVERYLTIFPNQADAVILDSICTLQNCHFDKFIPLTDTTGKRFLSICENDLTCSSKMNEINSENETPEEAYKSVLDNINNNTCNFGLGNFNKDDIRTALTGMLMNFYTRILIPSTIYRLNRCNEGDKKALKNLFKNAFGLKNKKYVSREKVVNITKVLYYNIVFSELWSGRSYNDVLEDTQNALFYLTSTLNLPKLKNSNYWNIYTDNEYIDKLPDTEIPILMLNGNLDSQTPIETAIKSKNLFNKNNQYFIEFPEVIHVVLSSAISEAWIRGDENSTCGEKIIFDFLETPDEMPDTTCINEIYKLSWKNSSLLSAIGDMYYGTGDIWDGTPDNKAIIKNSRLKKSIKESMDKTYLEYEKYPEIMNFIKNITK